MPKTATIDRCEKLLGNDPEAAKRNRQATKAIATLLDVWTIDPQRRKGDIETLLHNQTRWQWPIKRYSREELVVKSKELGEFIRERRAL